MLTFVTMDAKTFYAKYSREQVEAVAKSAGTTFANFQQIALYQGSVSKQLAKRLSEASDGEMTVLEILFPEEYQKANQVA